MTRLLLALLFVVMLVADTLNLNLSLAPGLSVKNAFIYLIFLSIAAEAALARNRRVELLSVIVPFGLCIFYAICTWLVIVLLIDYRDYDAARSLINLKSGFADHLVVFLVFFYGVLKSDDALSLLKMMIWTMMIANIITVVDALNLPDLGLIHDRVDGRVGGPVGEANQYAAILALFLPPILALALTETGLRRAFAFFGFAASVLAFLMTVSRGGFVGVFFGTAIGAILMRQYVTGAAVTRAIGAGILLCVIGVVGLYLAGYGELFYERVVGQSTRGSGFEISSGRSHIWGTALGTMFRNPVTLITGYGWDTYDALKEMFYAPHNTYLKIFFELGLIGIVLMLTSFVSIVRVTGQALHRAQSDLSRFLFAFVFGFLAAAIAIFFVDLTSPWILFWSFVGVAMRLAVAQAEPATSQIRRGFPTTMRSASSATKRT